MLPRVVFSTDDEIDIKFYENVQLYFIFTSKFFETVVKMEKKSSFFLWMQPLQSRFNVTKRHRCAAAIKGLNMFLQEMLKH